jgi:transposase-like protein
VLPGSAHKRCRVHFARNLMAMIGKGHQPMVSAAFKTVFAQVSGEDMHTQWDQVASTLEDRFPKGAALMTGAKAHEISSRSSQPGNRPRLTCTFGVDPGGHNRNPSLTLHAPCCD